MSDHLDRRKRLPSNHVFEAHNDHDPTQTWFLHVFGDVEGNGVHLTIAEDVGEPDMLNVKHLHWLSAAQCREFGVALIKAADKTDDLSV